MRGRRKKFYKKASAGLLAIGMMLSNMPLLHASNSPDSMMKEKTSSVKKTFTALNELDKKTKSEYDIRYLDMVDRMLNMEALAYPGETGEKTSESSAYNKLSRYDEATGTYQNWDQNWDEGHDGPQTPDGGRIFADIKGPGSIDRIWSANPLGGHLKIYIDGKEQLNHPFQDYFNGNAGFPFNMNELSYDAARGKNSYVPITFQESCKIVAYDNWGMFYQINYTTFAKGTKVEPFPENFSQTQKDALQSVNDFFANGMGTSPVQYQNETTKKDRVTIPANGSHTLYSSDTSGAVTGIRVKLNGLQSAKEEWKAVSELSISARWDQEQKPSVWTTLGGFFGSTTGIEEYKSLPLGVKADGTMYSYWYMPFKTGANITIKNDGTTPRELEYEVCSVPLSAADAQNTLRFHAKWNRMKDPQREGNDRFPDSEFLGTQGTGRFVGTSLHIYKEIGTGDPAYHDDWWWGEGDEKFFVDGEKFPSWFGTGAEDYFGYAWGTWTPFAKAYHAQPFTNGGMWGIGNRLNNRFHILDSVPFSTSFSANLEKYHRDGYSNMAVTNYWYLESGGIDTYGEVSLKDRTSYYKDPYPAPFSFQEGEDLSIISSSGMDKAQTQNMKSYGGKWSNDSHVVLIAGDGGYVKWYLNVPEDGIYNLCSVFTKGMDFGKVQHYLDDKKLGSVIDLYDPNIVPSDELLLGDQYLKAGLHVLEARIVGKNPSSRGTVYGMDYLKVEKQEETRLEGESLSVISKSDNTDVREQDMGGFGNSWSNGKHLVLVPSNNGDSGDDYYTMTLRLPVEKTGDYKLSAIMTRGNDFGMAQHYLDGKKIGNPVNLREGNIMTTPKMLLDKVHLEKGDHEFTVRMAGTTSDARPRYVYGLDYLSLIPYDKETDKATELEAEQLNVSDYEAPKIPHMQNLFWIDASAWGNQTHLILEATAPNQFMTLDFDAPEAGYYDIDLGYSKGGDFGVYQVYLNNEKVSDEIDGYDKDLGRATRKLTNVYLQKGKNTIKAVVQGKQDASRGYLLALDNLKLQKEQPQNLEGERLKVTASSSNTTVKTQSMHDYGNVWSGNEQLVMVPDDKGSSGDNYYYMNVAIEVPRDGFYDCSAALTLGPDFGVVQHFIDGQKIGTEINLMKNKVDLRPMSSLGRVYLQKGTHTFTAKMVSTKSNEGPRYVYGLDALKLTYLDVKAISYEETISDLDVELKDQPNADKLLMKLPETIKVKYSDDKIEDAVISWNFDAVNFQEKGTYEIIGTVKGMNDALRVQVVIKDTPVFVQTLPENIVLQLEEGLSEKEAFAKLKELEISAKYSDGTEHPMKVTAWDISKVNFKKAGTYTAEITLQKDDSMILLNFLTNDEDIKTNIQVKVTEKKGPEVPEKPENPDKPETPDKPIKPGDPSKPSDTNKPNNDDSKKDDETPKTNDSSNIQFVVGLVLISGILCYCLYRKRALK